MGLVESCRVSRQADRWLGRNSEILQFCWCNNIVVVVVVVVVVEVVVVVVVVAVFVKQNRC